MSPDLTNALRERYPLIFGDVTYIACGDGWFGLLDALCQGLQSVTKHGGPQVVAQQVKEKFGSLRFYTGGRNEEQRGMIELAALLSARVCDVCGNPGTKHGPLIIRTRCAEHVDYVYD